MKRASGQGEGEKLVGKLPRGWEGTRVHASVCFRRFSGWAGPVARMPRAKTPTEDPHHTCLLEDSLNLSQLLSGHEVFSQRYSFGL